MKSNFEYQTGNVYFRVDFVSRLASGEASINFGCDGLEGKCFSFHLKDGNLYDNDNIYFGSYLPNSSSNISGVFYENSCFYFYNGLPVRTAYQTNNQDFDFIELAKSGNGTYSLSYSIKGKDHGEDKNLLYISSNPLAETGITDMLEGMAIFNGSGGVQTGYSDFTGTISSNMKKEIESYSATIFGQNVSSGDFTDFSGWASIGKPIVFLNSEVVNQDCLRMFSGSSVAFSGYEMDWGKAPEGYFDEKNDFFLSATRRMDENASGAYDLYYIESGLVFNYAAGTGIDQSILYNDEVGRIISVDVIPSGEFGFSEAPIQSERRLLFNAPIGTGQCLYDITTDGWKKMMISCVYDFVELGTEVGEANCPYGTYDYSVGWETETKASYTSGIVAEAGGYNWLLNETLIGTSVSDKKVGAKSLRMRSNGATAPIVMLTGYEYGLRAISFKYGKYSTDIGQGSLWVEYKDQTGEWEQIGDIISGKDYGKALLTWDGELTEEKQGILDIRIRGEVGLPLTTRINIDDILIEGICK